MKVMILLSLFFLVTSCSNYRLETQIESAKNDVLSGESMLRYSQSRLERIEQSKNPLIAAVSKCYQENYTEGLTDLKKNLKNNNNNPAYWNHIGTCYYLDNQFAKAEYFFKLSLTTAKNKKKDFPSALNNLGLVQLKLRHYDSALDYFTKAEKFGIITPKFNKLQLYLQFGQIEKARTLARKLESINSNDVDVLVALATIHMLDGDYKTSEKYFKNIPKKFLDREDISGNYAIVLFKLKKFEEAKLALQNGQYTQIKSIKNMRKNLEQMIERELKLLKEERDAKRLKTSNRGSRAS
ncbi:MAG: tetratricopeptide repeat protein [Bacteriovoracaceae bacterium]|nr:tetratricopeptide repeat protein [Bacteriovoracaceae bacterium]